MMRTSLVFLLSVLVLSNAYILRSRRQTYYYPEELKKYAHPHPGTKIHQGYLARYAPQDWPKWYSRNMMQWNGIIRTSPYEQNDVRYAAWATDNIRRASI